MFNRNSQTARPVGVEAHERTVSRLRESFAALGPDETVRLAKKTSNLFRPRERATRGLDVEGLAGVISIDAEARTADVQGMCTYENLVDVTLQHGLMPFVVPQLRTITLGGAVTGAALEGLDARVGHELDGRLEDPGDAGVDDDGAVHLGQLPQAGGGELDVDVEAAGAQRLDELVVPEDDERAGVAAQDALESVAQDGARRDRGEGRAEEVVV